MSRAVQLPDSQFPQNTSDWMILHQHPTTGRTPTTVSSQWFTEAAMNLDASAKCLTADKARVKLATLQEVSISFLVSYIHYI